MSGITRGEAVSPIKLRDGDYLTELRDDFNAMLDSLQRRGVPVLKPLQQVESVKSKKDQRETA